MNPLIGLLMGGMGLVTGLQAGWRYGVLRTPRPMAKPLAAWLDHSTRLRFRNPGATVGLYGLLGGMTVLDAGCGTGTFSAEIARMIGPSGHLHALDMQQSLLDRAKDRLAALELDTSIQFHHAGIYAMPIKEASVDIVVLMSVLPEIPDKLRALAEVRRVLKTNGRVAVGMELVHPGYLPPPIVRQWFTRAGFRHLGTSFSLMAYDMLFDCEKTTAPFS